MTQRRYFTELLRILQSTLIVNNYFYFYFQKYLFAYMQLLKQSTEVTFFSKEYFLKLNKEMQIIEPILFLEINDISYVRFSLNILQRRHFISAVKNFHRLDCFLRKVNKGLQNCRCQWELRISLLCEYFIKYTGNQWQNLS